MNLSDNWIKIHESSSIGKNCEFGPHVSIEENCIIGDNVKIGAFTHIYHSCIIEDNVEIGTHCNIGSDGFGYAQNQKGESFFTPQLGAVVLKSGVSIFDHCSIDRGAFKPTVIEESTIIGGHSHIAHNLEIGKNSQIAPGFVVAGSTKIGPNAKIAYRVNCVGHLNICESFACDSMALINNNVKEPGHYAGQLLRKNTEWKAIEDSLLELPTLDLEKIREEKND